MKNYKSTNIYEYVAYFTASTIYSNRRRINFEALIVCRTGFPTEKFCLDTINRMYPEYLDVIITGIDKL